MTRPLARHVRERLRQADDLVDGWDDEAQERMLMQADSVRDAYPMADVRIAQFLAEVASSLDRVLAMPDDQLRRELQGYSVGLVILASVVTRRSRGRGPLRAEASSKLQ